MGFVNLHLHSEYSFLDGSIKIKELFKRVKELGQDAVAITEHGNMHALIQKYKAAKAEGVKLIIGAEVYLCEDMNVKDKKRYHLLLLAKNNEGLQNLIKIVSDANTKGFYYKPRVDKNLLRKYSKGLIATSACLANDIPQKITKGNLEKAKELAKEYQDIFGKDNFFIEVHNHGFEEEDIVRKGLIQIGQELGIDIIAANDAHYLLADDKKAHEIMLCIQTKKKLKDEKRMRFSGTGYHVMSEQEMLDLFPENPEFLENTVKIAKRCNVDLDMGNVYFPDFDVKSGLGYDEELKRLCVEEFENKYPKGSPLYDEAKERLDFELGVISRMGFSAYFLIVADFIFEAKKFCQVGPGRGSGAGSIVAYLTGITQLEPLSLGLLFERFLNPERVSLPDFDVDFGDRDRVLDYIREKYGEENVALIGTYGQMKSKAVLKDVARVLDIPFDVANKMTKSLTEKTIQKSLDLKDDSGNIVNKELLDYEKQYPFLFEIAKRLEGTVRQPGIHACGVVWGPHEITHYLSIFKKDANMVTQMDKNEVEERGLVKFDFLGLETLNIIQMVLDFIGKDGKWLEQVPMDDDNVYQLLRDAKSVGVFQLESGGMQKTLDLIKPTNFDDIIAIVALYRPGPMQYLEVYANRKHGREESTYPDEKAKEILEPTYGIMVYQEQVMQLSRKLAGFSMGESDVLRKAIGKKKLDLMMKCEKQFKEGCQELSGMQKKVVDKLWDDIVKFAAYSFNKSHAAAYALISYRTAYLKTYYPLEFYTAIISSVTNDMEKMAFYVAEARDDNVTVLPPCINVSGRDFSFEHQGEDKILRFGFAGVKNVGDTAIDAIIATRPYTSYQDFINKVDLSKVNKRVCKHLIMCGAFDSLIHNRRELLNSYEHITKQDKDASQKTLFGGFVKSYEIQKQDEYPLGDILSFEIEVLGLPISGNLLDQYPIAKNPRFDKLAELVDEREFESFVIVKNFREILTKKGDRMCFMSVEDRYATIKDIVVFPRTYSEIAHENITENMPLIIRGIMRDESLICNEIQIYRTRNNSKVEEDKAKYERMNGKKDEEKSLKSKNSLLNFC